MKSRLRLCLALCMSPWLACGVIPAFAHQVLHGDLALAHPFVRLDPACDAKVTRAYVMLIVNSGAQPDRLVGANIDQAGQGTLVRFTVNGEKTVQERLRGGIDVPAHGQVAVTAPGYAIEFPKVRQPLMEGGAVTGSLTFQRAGRVPVTFMVEAARSGTAPSSCGAPPPMPHLH